MTAPMFYAEAGSLEHAGVGGLVTVSGPEGRHAVRVRRIAPGERVLVADGSGLIAAGMARSCEQDVLVVEVDSLQRPKARGPRLTLVQALAKGGRDEQAVEAATELGIDSVVPWAAQHCVVQWRGDRVHKGQRKWENVVAAAAKQSRRPMIPVVEPLVTTAELIAGRGGARLVVLHEAAQTSIGGLDLDGVADGDRLMLVVGPEGGVSEAEREALVASGAQVVRLGPWVLRSSTAGPAALAVLAARLRW